METLIIALIILVIGWNIHLESRLSHVIGKIDALLKHNGIDPKSIKKGGKR